MAIFVEATRLVFVLVSVTVFIMVLVTAPSTKTTGFKSSKVEIVISSLINEVEKLRARVKELEQKNE